jgi:hypothetical protein
MPKDPRAALTPQLAIGIFIMLIGVLLTLDRLNIVDTARAVRFWPLAFIAVGTALLVQRADPHGRFWGFVWLFVGSWLLLNTLGVVRIGLWDLFWPALLIVIGVNLIRQTLGPGRGSRLRGVPTTSGNLFAVMSESKRAVVNEPFGGASMSAIMGGCILDLRQATLAPGQEAIVDVFGLMAGHEIVVPSGWTVVTDVVQVLAGVEDKRLPPVGTVPPLPDGSQPKLVLRGFLLLAGVTIKT